MRARISCAIARLLVVPCFPYSGIHRALFGWKGCVFL